MNGRKRIPLPKVAHPLRTVAPEVETDSIRPRGGAGPLFVGAWLALIAGIVLILTVGAVALFTR